MKKTTILILLIIVFLPFTNNAISLNVLKFHPELYIPIPTKQNMSIYYDSSQTKVIQYNPPYYTIETTSYYVAYQYNTIAEVTTYYNYDGKNSIENLIRESAIEVINEETSIDDKYFEVTARKKLAEKLFNNSGITRVGGTTTYWTLIGDYLNQEQNDNIPTEVKIGSPSLSVANFAGYRTKRVGTLIPIIER